MKKFLIFILGLVIGALAVYFLFPYTAKSQKETAGYVEKIDSLVQEGERLTEQLRIAERMKAQTGQPKQTAQSSESLGKKYFDNAIEYTGRKSFQVTSVFENGDAMACEVTDILSDGFVCTAGGTVVLLERDSKMPYYDRQVVQVAEGKKVLQVGIYRYKANIFLEANTIPIIAVR